MAAVSLLPVLGASPVASAEQRAIDLSELETRYGGRIGLCAEGQGRCVSWRADERFAYCSTFKLFLAACMLEGTQKGLERLDRAAPVVASDMVMHAPVTKAAVGSAGACGPKRPPISLLQTALRLLSAVQRP